MNGGARVAEVLRANGVDTLFTLCGGHISPILVEAKRRGIRVIDTRHEANAVFAADATARLTGLPGVAAVTAGPGVTNSVTAIKNARLAQSPVVLLGGATATMLRGRGSLQDIDQTALMRPHVKLVARPDNVRQILPALEQAFRVAREGVPGPVFVELAVDLLYDEATVRAWYGRQIDKPHKTLREYVLSAYIRAHLRYLFTERKPVSVSVPLSDAAAAGDRGSLRRAASLLRRAERPVMVLGSQVMLCPGAIEALVKAIEHIGVPVYLSGMARGLLGADHRLQIRHERRSALRESDLCLLAGVPCDFRLDYGSHVGRGTLVGVNLSAHDLRLNRRPDIGVLADPAAFLCALANEVGPPVDRRAWIDTLRSRDAAREAQIDTMADAGSGERINPLRLFRCLDAKLSDDSIVVGDGGDFVATAAYTLRPRRPYAWLDPGVFGTLGVGAGFALGAKLLRPGADVWLLYGDGAAGLSLLEIDSYVRHGVAVIAMVGNDAGWTQIARDQVPMLGDDVGTRLADADYHLVGSALGAHAIDLGTDAGIDLALEEALRTARTGRPVLINARIGRSDFRKGSISM